MAGKHKLDIRDFDAPKKPVDIPFTIKVSGKAYKGILTPDNTLLPSGVPATFICFIHDKPPTRISSVNGVWVMNAPDEIVKALGAWIEAYYE